MESQSPAVRSVKEDDEPAIRSSSCRKHESSLETETRYYCSPAVLLLVACVCVCVSCCLTGEMTKVVYCHKHKFPCLAR